MGSPLAKEKIDWIQRAIGVSIPSAMPGADQAAGTGNTGPEASLAAPASPSGNAGPSMAPGGSPPTIDPPPDEVLRRAGDGALFWRPNGGGSVAQASGKWISDLLKFYWLAPAEPEPAFTFNRAASDMAALTALVSDQARLAGFVALDADIQAAANKILEATLNAQFDAHQIAISESVMSDEDMGRLAAMKMRDMLDALETLRKDKQLDTVARRAKQPRLRLGVLAIMHDLGKEWSGLMKAASDQDQEAVRKHVYGSMVEGDATIGHAPKVDAEPKSKSSRALNSAEIAYVDRIFHGSIDYTKVRIGKGGITTAGDYARTIGNTIHMPTRAFVPGTMELDEERSDLLVHEMTHVWQYQHQGWTYAPAALWAQIVHRGGASDWRPAAKKRRPWTALNPEAQASAVEDYNSALRRVISGNADADDYETLKLVKPWQAAFVGGPQR